MGITLVRVPAPHSLMGVAERISLPATRYGELERPLRGSDTRCALHQLPVAVADGHDVAIRGRASLA